MFDFRQLSLLDAVIYEERKRTKAKLAALNKRPVGRNHLARARQQRALCERIVELEGLLDVVREHKQPHLDELRRKLGVK